LGNRAFRGVDVCSDQAAASRETERCWPVQPMVVGSNPAHPANDEVF